MNAPDALPKLDELPIPDDAKPDRTWPPQMIEMADHIGAANTLRIVAAKAGHEVYISGDASRSPFIGLVDDQALETLARIYGCPGTRFRVPTAKAAVARARRAPIIAAVRARGLTTSAGAKILGTTISYMSYLANHGDEGAGATPPEWAKRRRVVDPRQIDMFPDRSDDE